LKKQRLFRNSTLNANIANLFDSYFDEVPEKNWKKLFDVLQSQETTIRNSIMNEDGPLKKENAKNALNSLLSIFEDYISQNMRKVA